jgi:tRNA (adenine22-N1)-methyltransferase
MEEEKISSAIAMDVNRGPLERARENIHAHGLDEKIETRLSDGLAALHPGEVDSVVIAGMGGNLVIRILQDGVNVAVSLKELILQPQSDIDRVRDFLQREGFRITKEDMIFEDGKYYPMMHVVPGKMEPLTRLEALYGPYLLKTKHPCLERYLEKEEATLDQVKGKLLESGSEKAKERMEQIEKQLEDVRKAREVYL